MSAIVYQTNKKTGIKYAYESQSYWDKEKKQSRAKRKCIGKVDPVTGQIVPTRKRKSPSLENEAHLATLQEELKRGKRNSKHEPLYAKYFHVSTLPGKRTKVVANQEAIDEAKKNYGYFALISNEVKDPIEALELYRNKDLIEKAFGNLKERLNFRRTRVSSELSMDGKLFVTFVALIYLSYVKKKMQENNLFQKYTLQVSLMS